MQVPENDMVKKEIETKGLRQDVMDKDFLRERYSALSSLWSHHNSSQLQWPAGINDSHLSSAKHKCESLPYPNPTWRKLN